MNINNYIDKDKTYIGPGENAHKGLSVPGIVLEYGSMKAKIKSIPTQFNYMVGCINQMHKSYKGLYKQPQSGKVKISSEDLEALKVYIKSLAIDDIGFTEVDTSYIFSDKKILFKNAIVLLMEMKHEIISTTPSRSAEKEIFRTYYELGVAVNKIKEFLNKKGYQAEAGPALGGEVNYPLLAEKAGLGKIGKHGLLITPDFGPSLRLAAVYTDIENLPMTDHTDYLWIKEFCDSCNRCVGKCPGEAIYKDTKVFDDGTEEHIDYKKCAMPFSMNHGCTICVKECTFFKGDYDKIKRNFLKK